MKRRKTRVGLLAGLFMGMCLTAVFSACSGRKSENPLELYQGFTTDTALAKRQYEAVQPTIQRRFVKDSGKVPPLEHLMGASQSLVVDGSRVTSCWAFEFKAPQLGNAPVYNNVVFVVDGEALFYSYEEMGYQPREDGKLRLSLVRSGNEWRPAVPYVDAQWKCVGYESCYRYEGQTTAVYEWPLLLEAGKKMGVELDMDCLPFVKRQETGGTGK